MTTFTQWQLWWNDILGTSQKCLCIASGLIWQVCYGKDNRQKDKTSCPQQRALKSQVPLQWTQIFDLKARWHTFQQWFLCPSAANSFCCSPNSSSTSHTEMLSMLPLWACASMLQQYHKHIGVLVCILRAVAPPHWGHFCRETRCLHRYDHLPMPVKNKKIHC